MQRKMKIIISSIFWTAMIGVKTKGMTAGINSSHLGGRIFNGDLPRDGEYKYTVSLQLDGSHICGSGLFQKRFLITSALCAWHIGIGIQRDMKRATAVVGDKNLREGQRIYILKLAYQTTNSFYSSYPSCDYDVGVIMLVDKIDYTRVQILEFLDRSINLNADKYESVVCGWGTVTEDDNQNHRIENAEYSENLHCMRVHLRNETFCRNAIPGGNYRSKLICGEAQLTGQISTLRDIGNPLTKFIRVNGTPTQFIIGITLTRFIGVNGVYLRFYRSYAAFKDVQKILDKLQPEVATN